MRSPVPLWALGSASVFLHAQDAVLFWGLARDNPTVTYTIVDIDGKVIHTFDPRRSQLQAGGE